jgi:hypothetical protein
MEVIEGPDIRKGQFGLFRISCYAEDKDSNSSAISVLAF